MINRLFLLIAILIFSCTGSSIKNKTILSQQEMQEVLLDVMKADEMMAYQQERDSIFQPLNKRGSKYDTLFALHHTNKEQFKNSIKYYQNRPDQLKVILDSIQVKIDSMKVPVINR